MKDDGQRREQPNGLRPRVPAGRWRALIVGLLAVRVLSSHNVSADLGRSVTVTVTNYRICVLHGCNRTEANRPVPGKKR